MRRRNDSVSSDRPFVLTADCRGRRLLTAVDAAAEAVGLSSGMALADARALAPDVMVEPDDLVATEALLSRLADWCGRYTPWTAVEGQDGVWLDIAGCAHLFGGEAAVMSDLLARIRGFGFAARAALAPTPGSAWACARFAGQSVIIEEGETRDAIAALPIAGLRLEPEIAASLSRLGLRRIGDLYPLPRATVVARFGDVAARRLDEALGRVAEPISPRRPVAPFRNRLAFAEAIGHADDIARGLERLLVDLSADLARASRGGRRFELTFFRVDGSFQEIAIGTARATRDPAHLACLFQEELVTVDPGFGIETMVLAAAVTEKQAPEQAVMQGTRTETEEGIGALLDRLGNRLGFGRLHRLQAFESHLPDRAQRLAGDNLVGDGASIPELRHRPRLNRRPIRLLVDPEAMTPMTPEERDGSPPAMFRWRGRVHQLRRTDGPERISPEWWRQDQNWAGGARDYWRIEDAEGRRLWLFREGGGVEESCWFVHGIFA